jgi:hypothetical protein
MKKDSLSELELNKRRPSAIEELGAKLGAKMLEVSNKRIEEKKR